MATKTSDWETTRASLLLKIRDPGDTASWEKFWIRYHPVVHGFARRFAPSDADAEDLTQEIFIKVFGAIGKFVYDPDKGRFKGWLFRVSRNAITDWLRKHRRRLAGQRDLLDLGMESIDELARVEGDPLWPVFENEWLRLRAGVRAKVRRSMPGQYQFYKLVVEDGWAVERAAKVMDAEPGYVSKAKCVVEAAIQAEMSRLENSGHLLEGGEV
ncbi:MAG: RNA polymerase sigma factor [Limisphaerales bacterium]